MTDMALNPVTSGYNLSLINDNFSEVQDKINDDVLQNKGGHNTMNQQLDMDSNKIINVKSDLSDPNTVTINADLNSLRDYFEDLIAAAPGGNGSFLQAGTGAIIRTFQDKERDEVSVKDFGVVGTGTTDEKVNFLKSVPLGTVDLSRETILLRQAVIDTPFKVFGPGTLKQDTQNQMILAFWNVPQNDTRIKDWGVYNVDFGPMPTATSDNYSAVQFYNGEAPQVAFCNFYNTETCVRMGYDINSSVETRDGLVLGCYASGGKRIGVENIQSKYSRVIGLAMQNSGTQIGLHGVRYSGANFGSITVGSNIRDRGTTAVSFQDLTANCIVSATYSENVGQSGYQSNATTEGPGGHVISGCITKGAAADGFSITYLPRTLLSGVVESAGGYGLRTGTSTQSSGKNLADVIVHNSAGIANISTSGVYRIVGDGATGNSPCIINASNSIVDIFITNATANNTVQVIGNKNIIRISEFGNTGPTTVRIDGANNKITANTSGNTLVTGIGNLIDGVFGGNLTLSATSSNNKVLAIVSGTLANSGTNNTVV